MQVELNRATFRRLVQLYLAVLAGTVPMLAYEMLSPRWLAFSDRFDALVAQLFGRPGRSIQCLCRRS